MRTTPQAAVDAWRRTLWAWRPEGETNLLRSLSAILERLQEEIRLGRIPIQAPGGVESEPPSLSAETFVRAYEGVFRDLLTSCVGGAAGRRRTGSYFTPPFLVQPILEHALAPVLASRARPETPELGGGTPIAEWSAADRRRAAEAVASVRVCDPSCGAGDFLLAAGDWIADRLGWIRAGRSELSPGELLEARRDATKNSLFGVELSPYHAQASRLAIWIWSGAPNDALPEDAVNVRIGDALDADRQGRFAVERWFPAAFKGADPGFDVVLGNPPFANAIEGGVESAISSIKKRRREAFAELGGTADLSYYFLVLADRIAKSSGAVGFVLPRSVLSAPSARRLRERLNSSRPPAMIYAPPEQRLFSDANVYVAAVVLRSSPVCVASRDPVIAGSRPRFHAVNLEPDNWWAGLDGSAAPCSFPPRRLRDRFLVFASLTTGMAYDLRDRIVEEPDLPPKWRARPPAPLRIATTGLIEPGECLWGRRDCRYLKRVFRRPVVDPRAALPSSLADRLSKARRPKVLVAGLSLRIEAFLDCAGAYGGAVSTWTIVHPHDDVDALAALCDFLNGESASQALRRRLGATALGGGRITLTKEFLQDLPAP